MLWAHYADKHRGICLGFDVFDELFHQVSYVTSRPPMPKFADQSFIKSLMFTKYVHWSYEDEFRAYISLQECEDGLYFANFAAEMKLRQILIGTESSVTRAEVATALGERKRRVESFKVRAAFGAFNIVRQKDEELWR